MSSLESPLAKKAVEVKSIKPEPVVVRGDGMKRTAKVAPAKKAAKAAQGAVQGARAARGNTAVFAVGQPASRATKLSADTLALIAASFLRT